MSIEGNVKLVTTAMKGFMSGDGKITRLVALADMSTIIDAYRAERTS